jgi:hypothetical protein
MEEEVINIAEPQTVEEKVEAMMLSLYTSSPTDKEILYKGYKEHFTALSPAQKLTVEETLGICPSTLVESDRPERQEWETWYQYQWRRKLMKSKTNKRGVFTFVAGHNRDKDRGIKGKTFNKSNYSTEQLMNMEMVVRLRLKGIDPSEFTKEVAERMKENKV